MIPHGLPALALTTPQHLRLNFTEFHLGKRRAKDGSRSSHAPHHQNHRSNHGRSPEEVIALIANKTARIRSKYWVLPGGPVLRCSYFSKPDFLFLASLHDEQGPVCPIDFL